MKCYCYLHVSFSGGTTWHTWRQKVHLPKTRMTWQADESRSTQYSVFPAVTDFCSSSLLLGSLKSPFSSIPCC
ncbi:hypothetical protein HRI_005096100 [Hibiscus trionum]|uniref:Uncharacterized protein n=1 Tax=Hibiscus trionum TaxID=183268 RepID=A0A9W7JJ05_HIBTR|nr:hypothetical protein HRI_005096100 [Hibiscus trionum]